MLDFKCSGGFMLSIWMCGIALEIAGRNKTGYLSFAASDKFNRISYKGGSLSITKDEEMERYLRIDPAFYPVIASVPYQKLHDAWEAASKTGDDMSMLDLGTISGFRIKTK